jgi:hypothetical protein
MRIEKITLNTPDKYVVDDYLKYYRLADEHIVIIDNSFGEVFPINTDYEAINNHIFETWDTVSCYNVEDRGDYWEFIETEEEEYTEDYVELKIIRIEEVLRIEDLISKAIDTKQPQPFEEGDAYEIDIEYLEENNHNLFEAAVVLKYCNNPEKYFPIKGTYDSISGVLKGEGDDILHSIADQIYTHYYGEEEE